MQGVERGDRSFADAGLWAGHLVPPGSMFAFFAEHRGRVFPDEEYADLFAARGVGRPSWPATQMAAVLTLQVLHGYSDRETAEAVRFDVRWKAAIGLSLDERGFDPSVLVYWRRRIAGSDRPHRVNEAVREIAGQTGVLAGRGRRVADSTLVEDAVATQDTVTQLVSAVRRVMREVPGAAGQVAAACTSGHDYGSLKRPSCDWPDPAARDALVSALVGDARAVVAAVSGPGLEGAAADAVALLALIAGQDVEPAEGSDGTDGRWRIIRPEDKGRGKTRPDRVISVTDPQARHSRKNVHDRTDGYRAHIAAEPESGIITDEELTMASGPENSDAAAAARFVAREHPPAATGKDQAGPGSQDQAGQGSQDQAGQAGPGRDGPGSGPLTWYGDSAYGTGDLYAAISDAGDTAVIKPKTTRPGRFAPADFTPDEDAGTLTCPAGITRPIPPRRSVSFGTACRTCPLAAQCVTPQAQARTGRVVKLHPHDRHLRAARRQWNTSRDHRADYSRTRPHIERLIAHLVTTRGRRLRLRYRGTTRNHAWLKTRTAALNLRNLLAKGLRHDGTTWQITWTPAT